MSALFDTEQLAKFRGYVAQTIKGTFRFSGRSRRSEFLAYYVFETLLAGVIVLIADFWLEGDLKSGLDKGLTVLFALPFPGLFARRLHDFNSRGWWALPILVGFGYTTFLGYLALSKGIEARIAFEESIRPFDLLALPVILGSLLIMLIPGTEGPNRFGLDPRLQF